MAVLMLMVRKNPPPFTASSISAFHPATWTEFLQVAAKLIEITDWPKCQKLNTLMNAVIPTEHTLY